MTIKRDKETKAKKREKEWLKGNAISSGVPLARLT